MNPTPEPRAVLVSGCSADFGFRAARALALRGHVVVAGIREPAERGREQAEALRRLVETDACDLTCVPLDVDDDASVEAAVKAALEFTGGRLDALVNSAAYSVLGPLEACRPAQLLAELNTNVVGALRLLRGVLPVMRHAGRGRVVQLTSGLARAAVPFMGAYSASAWAQECLAEVLSYETAAFGVEVAILEPAGYRSGGRPTKPVGDQDRLEVYEPQLVAFAEHLYRHDPPADEDPEEVAAAVVATVEAAEVALRTPVGEAARKLVTLRSTLTAAEYEREILERTGLAGYLARVSAKP